MSFNVTVAGASYADVPSIELPITGGGTAEFFDITDAETALGTDGSDDLDVEISALTTYANSITGACDSDLSSAVATLAAGYGGGGGYDLNEVADGSISGAVTLDTATNIRGRFFKECSSMTSLTAPYVKVLREQICSTCTSLQSISFPKATTVNSTQQFISCTSLTSVDLPLLTTPAGNMFQSCTSLEIVDFPCVTTMAKTRLFYGCYKLQTIILRYTDEVVPLNSDALTNTPFAGYNSLTGTVYVPSDLISSYQSASNWSTLYNNGTCSFVALEGSAYE